nr:MATE family efflux transporter [Alteromonas lipotrueiana]
MLIAQITQMLMGVVDTIMAGQYNAVDMAAVALGFSITIPLMCFLQGVALALPPIISRYQGKGASGQVAFAAQQAGYLLLVIGIAILSLYPVVPHILKWFPMEPELHSITLDYVRYVLLSMPAFALYQWLRNYCEGLGNTKPTMIITVIGLGFNIVANYLFIYGAGPIPAFGGAGCGIATAIVITVMFFSTLLYTARSRRLKVFGLYEKLHRPALKMMLRTFKLGFPVAMTLLFEVTLFAVVALLLAPFGATTVAAHQVALNFSSLMFMFPLSMGMAVSIRVGYRVGQRNYRQARTAVHSALVIGLLVAIGTASFTLLAKDFIIGLYTSDPAVSSLASALLIYAAMFQFSDAIQVISANTLRGYKDTTAMFIISFLAYWGVGLPTGVILGRTNWVTDVPMEAAGFWIGIIAGLSCAAVLLGARVYHVIKQQPQSALA